jgi:hypothetical protein
LFEKFFYSDIGVICCRVRFVFPKWPTKVVTTKWKLDYYKSLKIKVTSLETCRFLQIQLYIGQRMRGKHVHSTILYLSLIDIHLRYKIILHGHPIRNYQSFISYEESEVK